MKLFIITVFLSLLLLSGCSNEIVAKPVSPQDIMQVQNQTSELQQKELVIPEVIENYIFVEETEHKDCDSLEEIGYPDMEMCREERRLQYHYGDKTVFVILSKTTKGSDIGKKYIMTNFSDKTELVDNNTIYRIENHELMWFPKSGFDMLAIQEGAAKKDAAGTSYQYGTASKDNPVFRRFLADYPAE